MNNVPKLIGRKSSKENSPLRIGVNIYVSAFHWLRLMWPFLLVVGAGWLLFGNEVLGTIRSTQHPVLVYGIFIAAVLAAISVMLAVSQYLREANVALTWLYLTEQQRFAIANTDSTVLAFAPVYKLLAANTQVDAAQRQSIISAELDIAQEQLEGKLELSNFIGGALVGLGLIGTFVGLLSTLDDLSHVFSSLVNSGSSTVSPTQMFADMVAKLQAPMRGMGTAFVASLYGLLGSLMITMMLVGANKSSAYAVRQIHLLVRKLNYGCAQIINPGSFDDVSGAVNVERFEKFADDLKQMKESIDGLARRVVADRQHQDIWAKRNAEMVVQMLSMVKLMSEQHCKLQEQIHVDLESVRSVLQAEHSNLSSLLDSTRRDTFETVKAIEACRQSFDHGAKSLKNATNIMTAYSLSDQVTSSVVDQSSK